MTNDNMKNIASVVVDLTDKKDMRLIYCPCLTKNYLANTSKAGFRDTLYISKNKKNGRKTTFFNFFQKNRPKPLDVLPILVYNIKRYCGQHTVINTKLGKTKLQK